MFYSLKGILKEILPPNRLILETSGISWEVLVPYSQLEEFKKQKGKGVEVFLTVLIKKSERLELYGFKEKGERELFLKLINLSKIGPNLALNILSTFSPSELREVVLKGDVKSLVKVPGIGPKRAERLLVEMKSLFLSLPPHTGEIFSKQQEILEEARHCLVNLGFKAKEAEKLLLEVLEPEDTLETLLKKALQRLSPV
jgi:Holliday junction DNA helicase RuvA